MKELEHAAVQIAAVSEGRHSNTPPCASWTSHILTDFPVVLPLAAAGAVQGEAGDAQTPFPQYSGIGEGPT